MHSSVQPAGRPNAIEKHEFKRNFGLQKFVLPSSNFLCTATQAPSNFISVDLSALKAAIQKPLIFISVDPSALQAMIQKLSNFNFC